MQRIAVATDDVLGLLRFLLERRVVGRQSVTTIRPLDQKLRRTIFRLQTVNHLFRQHDAQGIAKAPDFQFDHACSPRKLVQKK